MENLQLVLPEIFLSLSIMFLLILGVFKKNSSRLVQSLSLAVLIVTAVITFNETIGINETKLFNNSIIIDYLSSLMKIITLLAAFLVLIISSNPFASIGLPLGLMNKKSGVALLTKNEAIFFGLANSFNNESIVSLSFIKKGRNISSLELLFKMYKSK